MDALDTLKVIFTLSAIGAAAYAFWRPRGVFRFAGIAILVAIAAPFVLAVLIGPFLGSGAGMGVALILYALSAFSGAIALSATVGAGARYGWNTLR
jgi:hypothetical protein